jgi:hypothetical protein
MQRGVKNKGGCADKGGEGTEKRREVKKKQKEKREKEIKKGMLTA